MRKRYGISCCFIFSFFLLMTLNGCGTLPNGRGWGKDATFTPGWNRVGKAALSAALSYETWVPLAGALALQIDDLDDRLSDWASDENPVFGNREDADRWSGYLRDTSAAAYFATALATPSGDDPGEWAASKAKGIAVGMAAWGVTAGSTDLLKKATDRTRPNGEDDRSLPSGHASTAGSFTTLARRNVDSLKLSSLGKTSAKVGLFGLAVGTAWARVESEEHYPSDVLVGYALGHFFSAFIQDAFLGLDMKSGPFFTLEPSKDGVMAGLHWTF
ncbi:MAG: phosphatase PAP2 family protein [Desulfobacteraceae bacterium]|nr:MAG: phosphatase PAP2 family protein [Desulfobacteraceae bacterium]